MGDGVAYVSLLFSATKGREMIRRFSVSHSGTAESTTAPRFSRAGSFVVGPHAEDLDGLDVVQHLIDKPVLDVDPAGTRPCQVAKESLVGRGSLIRVLRQNLEKALGGRFQAGAGQLLCIVSCLARVDESPTHQPGSAWHFSTGVFSPRRIEARIPGMEAR